MNLHSIDDDDDGGDDDDDDDDDVLPIVVAVRGEAQAFAIYIYIYIYISLYISNMWSPQSTTLQRHDKALPHMTMQDIRAR